MDFMDQKEIAHLLAKELFYQQFINLEGIHSGVPTITTPTLTPTTLRNIEQTFIELQCKPESHENEAGFVPPLVHTLGNHYISNSEDIYSTKSSSNIWQSSLSQSSSDSNTRPTPPVTPKSSVLNPGPTLQTRRNMGGRKPQKDVNISPEEEERRKIRRERNKAAAARCRKRRVDHTNALIKEVESLEDKKQALQNELQELITLKEELQYHLDQHKASQYCHLQDSNSISSPPEVKPYVMSDYEDRSNDERVKTEPIEQIGTEDDLFSFPPPCKKIMLTSIVPISKPSRPNSLNVAATAPLCAKSASELTGICIQTPSSGLHFNYDSLMLGGTGLTPVSAPLTPNCSTQQRIPVSTTDLSSPDNCNPPKLVSL